MIERTATLPRRIDAQIAPLAAFVGWVGVVALVVLALLSVRPDEEWPTGFTRARLPLYVTVALVAASLLGWTFVQRGQARIERYIGRGASLWVFVFLPLAAAGVGLLAHSGWLPDTFQARWQHVFDAARWVAPASAALCLLAFLTSRPLRGPGRRAFHVVLLVPYVALLATTALGFELPFVAESVQEGLSALGGGAIALQLLIAWFVGSG